MKLESLLETIKNILIVSFSLNNWLEDDDFFNQTIDRLIDYYDDSVLDRFLICKKEFILNDIELQEILCTFVPKNEINFFERVIQHNFYVKLYVFLKREL